MLYNTVTVLYKTMTVTTNEFGQQNMWATEPRMYIDPKDALETHWDALETRCHALETHSDAVETRYDALETYKHSVMLYNALQILFNRPTRL